MYQITHKKNIRWPYYLSMISVIVLSFTLPSVFNNFLMFFIVLPITHQLAKRGMVRPYLEDVIGSGVFLSYMILVYFLAGGQSLFSRTVVFPASRMLDPSYSVGYYGVLSFYVYTFISILARYIVKDQLADDGWSPKSLE